MEGDGYFCDDCANCWDENWDECDKCDAEPFVHNIKPSNWQPIPASDAKAKGMATE
jgi:hypothetical protein